jgi:hypothetical protein
MAQLPPPPPPCESVTEYSHVIYSGDVILEYLHKEKCIAGDAVFLTIRPTKIGYRKVYFYEYTPTKKSG